MKTMNLVTCPLLALLVVLCSTPVQVQASSPAPTIRAPSDDSLLDSGGLQWAMSVVVAENVLASTPSSLLQRIRSALSSPFDAPSAMLLGYCAWQTATLHPDAFFASKCLQPPTYPSTFMLVTFTVIGTPDSYCKTVNISQFGNYSSLACFGRSDLAGEFQMFGSSSNGFLPTTSTGQAAAVVIIILFLVALVVCACVLYRKVLKPQEEKAQATGDLGGPTVAYGRTMRQVNYEEAVSERVEMAPREYASAGNTATVSAKRDPQEFDQIEGGPQPAASRTNRAPPAAPPQVSMEPPAPGTVVPRTGRVTMDIEY